MKILIRGGHVADPDTGRDGVYDVLLGDGKILKVEKKIGEGADRVIDAAGLYVMPGFVDLHVHLRDPGLEYKETIHTGGLAAARGGVTTMCAMPNTVPVTDSPEMIKSQRERAKKESPVHISFVGAVTKGQQGKELTDIPAMKREGMRCISEDGKSVMDSGLYRRAMKIAARDILLAKETGARLHLCHCSTKDSVEMVRLAKKAGLPVTAEVCPHHFCLTCEDIPGDDGNYKMNPPLREQEDADALIKGLKEGIIDVISTDHAPHSREEKARGFLGSPFGIVGLETSAALVMTRLVHTGILTPMEMADRMSRKPARILGVDRGSLAEGKAADVVLLDMDREYVIHKEDFLSKGKNTPFDGWKAKGAVVMTIVDGKIVYEEKQEA